MKKIQILFLLFLGILLTGCIQPSEPTIQYIEKIKYEKYKIPEEYLNCKKVDVNASSIKVQSDIARLIIELDEAYTDCYNKVNAIKKEISK